jgi:hypothetical protein
VGNSNGELPGLQKFIEELNLYSPKIDNYTCIAMLAEPPLKTDTETRDRVVCFGSHKIILPPSPTNIQYICEEVLSPFPEEFRRRSGSNKSTTRESAYWLDNDLNIKSLLYYQAELVSLEAQLKKQEWSNSRDAQGDGRWFFDSEDGPYRQRREDIIEKIRETLEKYSRFSNLFFSVTS